MRLLDLYCGAGGAAMGYHQAGFTEIVGVDIEPQPSYPFDFIQADVLDLTTVGVADLIHASPPCQLFSTLRHSPNLRDDHRDLIAPTRELLERSGLPYVIENVPGAPIRRDLVLCGSMFGLAADGFVLRRHRIFELSHHFDWLLTPPHDHTGRAATVVGDLSVNPRAAGVGRMRAGLDGARRMMGVEWMSTDNAGREIAQAIPPAYTRYIGEHFIGSVVPA